MFTFRISAVFKKGQLAIDEIKELKKTGTFVEMILKTKNGLQSKKIYRIVKTFAIF
jgi:hypothetical protein